MLGHGATSGYQLVQHLADAVTKHGMWAARAYLHRYD